MDWIVAVGVSVSNWLTGTERRGTDDIRHRFSWVIRLQWIGTWYLFYLSYLDPMLHHERRFKRLKRKANSSCPVRQSFLNISLFDI